MNQSEPIVFMDSSKILEGKLEELKTTVKELVEFVEANEPQTIAYNVYFSEDGTLITVAQVHADSASMEYHMKTAGPVFPKFKELLRLSTMDIYGRPSNNLLEQMRQKAQMLGNATVVVHELHAGFTRFGVGRKAQ